MHVIDIPATIYSTEFRAILSMLQPSTYRIYRHTRYPAYNILVGIMDRPKSRFSNLADFNLAVCSSNTRTRTRTEVGGAPVKRKANSPANLILWDERERGSVVGAVVPSHRK